MIQLALRLRVIATSEETNFVIGTVSPRNRQTDGLRNIERHIKYGLMN